MSNEWKQLSVLAPSRLKDAELKEYLHKETHRLAAEAGDWAGRIQIGSGLFHTDGVKKWDVSYQPGPPGVFTE